MTSRITFLLVSNLALLLCAALVVISSAGGQRAVAGTVTVMSQNLYQGFDAEKFLADVSANPANVVALTTAAYAQVLANDFAARADAVALAVDQHRPALIGLQEVSLYRSAPFDGPGSPHATNVEIDYLDTLLDALSARGLSYAAVASVQNTDAEFPRLVGFDANNNPILQDIRLTDRDVILARTDLTPSQLEVSNPQSGNYSANFSALGITFSNGWTAVDVEAEGRALRFVSTHLALSPAAIQELQAAELVAGLANTSLPTILVGDFNSCADGNGTASYANLVAAGFSDAWGAIHPDDPGYTCCQAANLLNAPSQLSERIDLALFRNGPVAMDALVVGAAQSDRTPTGLWQSDHAGIVATLTIVPEPGTLLLVCFGGVALVPLRRSKRVPQIAAALFSLVTFTAAARADIFQWEYINPANPSQGKQPSATLTPGGAGAYAGPSTNLSNRNLTKAYLIGAELQPTYTMDSQGYVTYFPSNLTGATLTQADLTNASLSMALLTNVNFSQANLTNAYLDNAVLTNVNFSQANLTNANLYGATVTGANFVGAEVRGANFSVSGLTTAQLYSTASYQAHDLTGIQLPNYNLSGVNLSGQNLSYANLMYAVLSGANLAGANIHGANLTASGMIAAQLYSTSTYQSHNLTGIGLGSNNLSGANLTGQNLTNADLRSTNLTGANISQANLTGTQIAGANFDGSNLTPAHIYATASYQTGDIGGIGLANTDLTGVDFSNKSISSGDGYFAGNFTNTNLSHANLTNAILSGYCDETGCYANVIGANLTGAEVRGANFAFSGISAAQLASTASYQAHDLHGIVLTTSNLSGINLAGQNLSNAYLNFANLSNADVSQANLANAYLYNAIFTGANLSGADARGANFQYATLSGANLSSINLTNANLEGATLTNANFSQANLTNASVSGTLTGATFTGAEVRGATLSGITPAQLYSTASYQAHDLTGIGLNGSNFAGANLSAKNLTNAKFTSATLTGANLSQANLTNADLRGATLTNANFSQANLRNADFWAAAINGTNFTNSDVRGAKFDYYPPYYPNSGISLAQLYSTASYQAHDLTGIAMTAHNLAGINLAGQNLTNADLHSAKLSNANFSQANLTNAYLFDTTLTGANFTGADIRGASFYRSSGTGIAKAQLYATANYLAHDLSGIDLTGNSLAAVNLVGQNLTGARFESATLTGANLIGANAAGTNFYSAVLSGANLSSMNLTGTNLQSATLTNANFSQANLTHANLFAASLTGAIFTGAQVQGAQLTGITPAQLYATASYEAHDLSGISLYGNNLAGVNLVGQNLNSAGFNSASLIGANFSQANLTNSTFSGSQVCDGYGCYDAVPGANLTNANFSGADARGANFQYAKLTGANLSGATLTNANFSGFYDGFYSPFYTDLTNANLSGADARGANFEYAKLTGATTSNLIQSNGHVAGLNLTASKSLVVRDYDGNPNSSPAVGPLPIVVDQSAVMNATGALRLVFGADAWDSTISFAIGIPVTRAGTLELLFAPDVILATQIGRTIDLFNWTGVTPTGTFTVSSPYSWNLTNLYTTGEVTLTAVSGILPGDFNNDSKVDAADYIAWRKNGGTAAAYDSWRAHFGQTAGSGSALPSAETLSAAVPEPAGVVLLVLSAATFSVCRTRRITGLLILCAMTSLATTAQAASYIVTDLGALGGTESLPWSINSSGQVTGYATTTDDATVKAFLWNPTTPNGASGVMYDLGTLGGTYSWGTGINVLGQVAGVSATTDDAAEHATLWNPTVPNGASGTLHDLGTLGGPLSQANAANVSGQVAGFSDTAQDGVAHAFLWNPAAPNGSTGTMHDIGSLGGSFAIGWDINSNGQVTGDSDTLGDAASHAFLWKPTIVGGASGVMHDLGTLGGTDSGASEINSGGQVAGWSDVVGDEDAHAFLWTPTLPGGVSGSMLDLGTLGGTNSYSIGLTTDGRVVGASDVEPEISNYSHAFLYSASDGMVDLNTLIDPLSGWELLDADDVNDAGQITGQGLINDEYHAFLLTPAPIPGDFNHNGTVDAADYVVWRKTGINGPQGYIDWRSHFGQTVGSGSSTVATAAVPEPSTAAMLVLAAAGVCSRRRRAA